VRKRRPEVVLQYISIPASNQSTFYTGIMGFLFLSYIKEMGRAGN